MFGNNSKFDYCGNVIYRDGALERLQGDNGYMVMVEPPHIPPKAGDYRAAEKEQHRPSPSSGGTEGDPYGALMGGGTVNNPGIQPYKYGTKELDRQNGLNFGGNRGYDLAF